MRALNPVVSVHKYTETEPHTETQEEGHVKTEAENNPWDMQSCQQAPEAGRESIGQR